MEDAKGIIITYKRRKGGNVEKLISSAYLTDNDDRNNDIVRDIIDEYCDEAPLWCRFEIMT